MQSAQFNPLFILADSQYVTVALASATGWKGLDCTHFFQANIDFLVSLWLASFGLNFSFM